MSRIVIDARESGTSSGRYVDKLLKYLHDLQPQHEIIVVTKLHRMDYVRAVAPNFTRFETSYEEFGFGEQLGFKRQLEGLKADLVHFGMIQQPIRYRGLTVTTMHDLTTARFRNPAKQWLVFWIKQQVYKRIIVHAARKSRILLTPTEYVKTDVANFARVDPDKIIVTYEAADTIDEPAIAVDGLEGVRFLMYIGRPTPHKNLPRLIQAFKQLKLQYPDLKLVLAGKKDILYSRIEKVAHKQEIDDIIFTDYVNEGQLRWLYEHCAAYVFPSLSEGFGLPGLEAMVHGAPVVSSNATCLPEVYGEGALYFDPLSSDDMCHKIGQVLESEQLRTKLIIEGKKQAARYSWRRMTEQTLAVYETVLKATS